MMKNKNNTPIFLSASSGMQSRDFKSAATSFQWLKDKLGPVSFNSEILFKILVCGALLVLFSLLQTTLFARFALFGVVPDLVLPLVCAVAISEREKWGAVFGIIAAFVIESLGGTTLTILPLLYMPVGYICGILSTYYFRDSFVVRYLYIAATSLLRAVFSLFVLLSTVGGITFVSAMTKVILPELVCNLLFALLPHYVTKLCMRPFNKSRDEKVQYSGTK